MPSTPRTTSPGDARHPLAGKLATPGAANTLRILLILDLAYLVNAMDRQLFPVIVPEIRDAYGFTGSEAGLLATIFTLGMGLAGIPAGYLTDRWGRKRVVLGGLVLFSVTTALQAVAVGWFDMATYRVLSGVGEGVQNAALFAAAGSFLHRSRGLAIGTIAASFGLGAFIGPLLGSFLVGVSGHWQTPLIVFGLLGGVVYATVRFGVPTAAMEYGAGETSAARAAEMGVGAVGKLMNRNVVCSAVAAAAVGYAIYGYLGLYPTYLRDAHGFTAGQASLAVSMFGVGALGAVPGGLVADRVNQRLLNVAGLLGMMLIGTVMFGLSTPLGVQMVLSLLLGVAFTGIIYTNTSALMQRSVAPHLVGRVSGLFVAALYLPASVSGYGLAVVVEGIGWTAGGIIQLTVIPVLGLLAMAVMRPTARPGTARPPATTISPSAVTDDRHS